MTFLHLGSIQCPGRAELVMWDFGISFRFTSYSTLACSHPAWKRHSFFLGPAKERWGASSHPAYKVSSGGKGARAYLWNYGTKNWFSVVIHTNIKKNRTKWTLGCIIPDISMGGEASPQDYRASFPCQPLVHLEQMLNNSFIYLFMHLIHAFIHTTFVEYTFSAR